MTTQAKQCIAARKRQRDSACPSGRTSCAFLLNRLVAVDYRVGDIRTALGERIDEGSTERAARVFR